MFTFTYLLQTRTTLLQWEDTEVSSNESGFNEADLEEVKENESFIQFVENYEQAYAYCEKHNEPGGHIGNGHISMHREVTSFKSKPIL